MEWYYGSGVDDLVVPRDQEPLDRLPSPNSWSLWGVSDSFKSPNKYFISQRSSIGEEPNLNGKGLYEEVDMDYSPQEEEHSSDSSLYQGFYDGSLQQATSHWEIPDYEFSGLTRTTQADDIFTSSMLEEGPTGVDNMDGSFNFIPEFGYGVLPADNLLMDMVTVSHYDASHFSPLMNGGHGEVIPCNLRQKDNTPLKALVARFAASSEVDMNELVDEKTSMEASILHELEEAIFQLSEKTRICFRDALYHLAEDSEKYTENHSQNGDLISDKLPQLTVHDETLRLENTKTVESATNSIDRVVANLLFSKMHSEQESNETTGQSDYTFSQTQRPHYPQHTSLCGDAEVPIYSKEKPPGGDASSSGGWRK